ncbi:MAG: signal transduction histidine kinase, partial [Paraglaciecola sp.]
MKNKRHLYYWGIIYILLIASCQIDKTSPPTSDSASQIFTLEKDQPYYQLQSYIQILEDATSKHSIEDILQSDLQDKFQAYPNHTLNLQNHKYYWGKIQLENHLPDAAEHLEWVLSFSTSWTEMDIYTQDRNGKWRQERNGIFTPERTKKFVPTTKGNLMKIALLPEEVVTIYFRGISERASINPSFYVYLENLESYYNDLLKTKTNEAIYLGFLLMMFLYNLIVYFFGRDRSFIFYSGYLIMMVIYSGYTSGDLTNWLGIDLFPNHPQYWIFMKLSIYLGLMCYLAFIRSFLDLKELLPKWGLFYKIVIYLGFPLVLLDVFILYLSNFSNVIEDTVSIFYIIFVMVTCCSLIYPLFKTKDKKGYFIIAGIAAISIGSILTIFSRVSVTNFSIFYLQGGTIIEVIIFSLGLAYRQRKQEQAKQQADFKLKESQLIQEKKQIEANRLKELNGFKARFYTNITHEFRTPLTVIMGMSDNLKNHSQEKKLIQRNSKNLLRLINQLLDLSKLESGTLQLNNIHQDIIAYLQYLTESFYSAATQKNIRLLFYSEEKVIMMDFDEEKIQQIVYNLLSNALKFTPRDGKIIFHANQTEQDGQPFLKLKIKDTGIGISPKNISHIFDRFYQVNHSGHYKEEGTGIGLALTKELVELMDGQIEVESQPKEGTEFTLNLPVKAQMKATVLDKKKEVQKVELYEQQPIHFIDENKKENKTPKETQPILISSFPELLIIEDNSDIITYIKTILNNDYNIHTAKNG